MPVTLSVPADMARRGYSQIAEITSGKLVLIAGQVPHDVNDRMVGDGDFNMAPGVLWTATHHKIPILYLVHNNRAYHQEVMMILKMADRRMRSNHPNLYVGTKIENPNIDYAKIAQGYGMFAEGPVSDPKDLAAAIRRGVEQVKRGEPALIDIVSDGR